MRQLNLNQMIEAGYTMETILNRVRKIIMDAALERAHGNIGKAAHDLGIHRNTFSRRRSECHEVQIRFERDPPLTEKELKA